MSCKEAAAYPERIDPSDTRFVECGRPALPIGEAANLGKPIYVPERGPLPHEARRYTRDSCDDGGGAISEFSLFYDEKDLGTAINCARARCQRNDPRGCEDLGRLHSDTVLPGVRKDDKTATEAFTRGCELGWGRSCLSLAHMAEARGDLDRAIEFHTAACNANPPDIFGCNRGGGALFKQGKAEAAKPLLQRGCRGVMPIDNIFAARRDGCILLAAMAEQAGDLAAQREYLRLACAYGHDAIQACEELGLLLVRGGDIQDARSYLHASCESLPSGARHSSAACSALSEIKKNGGSR
jgi:TPR repeat protein